MSEQEWIFTFGFGHTHPKTGQPLANSFMRVRGTREEARQKMWETFGNKWAFDYPSEEAAGVQKYNLWELEAQP